MTKAVGFYWTLPVTWAQFTDLPSDVEAAAAESNTIRYQMQMIRRYAKDHGFGLIREEVFLEISPDRGSVHIQDSLEALEDTCNAADATILIVDFSMVQNWRGHGYLDSWFEKTDIPFIRIPPDPLLTADWSFDPGVHFGKWRKRHTEWMGSKLEREAAASHRALELKAKGLGVSAVAKQLNTEKIASSTGKPWTESNLRAFLKKQR
ncbi:hypothetical protein PH7735_00280 [Shimia thalassica]|uniref:Recombinase domain-containing protein n=1 Tax=Shimia thalassica TaxID=1715693 RepID=A0A0N7M850_9RHOB|nr:recombinase family protein [Shimia thalassica]CUJ83577.1 hypothetical protein PH7735_00280 [Shimia thalassica]